MSYSLTSIYCCITYNDHRSLSVDETGDYIEWCRHPSGSIQAEKYGTLFNVRRSGPYQAADVDFLFGRRTATAQPQPVGIGPPTMLNSIWGYINSTSITGAQIDALREHYFYVGLADDANVENVVAGPDRPPPKAKIQRPAMPEARSVEDGSSTSSISGAGTSAQSIANSAAGGVGNLYSRLNNALAERGCVP
jgi:syntaxin-binding protein 5